LQDAFRKRDKNTNKQGFSKHCTEKFEDTKGLIRKKIEGQTIQWPKEKGQTGQAMNYNTPHVCLCFCPFSFGHCNVCHSIYGF
jgi:hypothetical protein